MNLIDKRALELQAEARKILPSTVVTRADVVSSIVTQAFGLTMGRTPNQAHCEQEMNCTECKGSGFVALATDTNAMCYACNGTGLGTTVHCIICEKEEPRRHPGHFMCGNPECRAEIVKIVEAHKMKNRSEKLDACEGALSVEKDFGKLVAEVFKTAPKASFMDLAALLGPCKCGHSKLEHETRISHGKCCSPGCNCETYEVLA